MRHLLKILCLVSIIASCNKDHLYVPALPPATESGDNTMGFIYNDSLIWIGLSVMPVSHTQVNEKPALRFTVQANTDGTTSFILDAQMYIKQTDETVTANSEMSILIGNAAFTNRTYTFDNQPSPATGYVTFKNKLPSAIYYNMPYSFSLTITHVDVDNHIISGVFSGTLFSYNNGAYNTSDSLTVQSGRFDASYVP